MIQYAKGHIRRIDNATVEVTCTGGGCKKKFTIPFTVEQQKQWEAGALLQRLDDAVPHGYRELLISGTCDECWDNMFGQDEIEEGNEFDD